MHQFQWKSVGCLCGVGLFIAMGSGNWAIAALYPDRAKRGMVTSAHPLASEVGVSILQQGGNAIDAAVATTLAISVVEPFAAGIGGGGFLLMRQGKTGEIKALDFRERAPIAASRTMYLDERGQLRSRLSADGHLAVAVPGTIAGLREFHSRYGTLPWSNVVTPAIRLAEQGVPMTRRLSINLVRRQRLQQNPAARTIFMPKGQLLEPGDRLIQTDLARTLRTISDNPAQFYTGEIAHAIVADMKANGGLITLDDLKRYRPIWRDPVCGNFRSFRVCSMPPPSSGGVHLIQMLNILSPIDFKALGWHSPDALHWITETMRIAYADRAQYLGDPAFTEIPVKALISPAYANQRRQMINLQRAQPITGIQPASRETLNRLAQEKESPDTSHLNVIDSQGNAVSLTFTINQEFGAAIVATGTGILLNNEMDDFDITPDNPNELGITNRNANAIASGKTPRSSMSPTIITKDGQLYLLVGSPGGGFIITTVLQIVLNHIAYGMDIHQAIAAPRLHHRWLPNKLRVEPWGFDKLTLEALRQRGHTIDEQVAWGNANAIIRLPDGWLEGAIDPRGEGTAYGW